MTDVFLSYSREDQAMARRFAEAFEREGLTVWWDQTLRSGENYDQVTEAALRDAKAVVVLWSKHSVDSRWVRAEATQADRNGTLVPVMIEPCNRPIMFELKHTAELAHWKGDAADPVWKSFLGDIRQFVKKEAPPVSPGAALTISARRPGRLGTAITLAIVAVLAAGVFWNFHHARRPVVTSATPAAAATVKEVTLAVLPFADMSTTHDQESFSDGLSEEILNQLAQIKAMRVTGRTSSFSFKGKNEDLRVIAEKLGVGNLLEGSIRKDGTQLRITAQLINGKDGTHLWSQTYNRELSGIFALQEDIAKDVARALSITLDVGDIPRAQGGTTNIEAYDKFLRAEALSDLLGNKELDQSIKLYREAVALDPGFERAWYGLYGALELTLVNPDPTRAVQARKEMAEITARVVSLAPDAWWTQTMLAQQYRADHKWAENEAAVSKAVALAPPSQISVITTQVLFLWAVGRARESADYMVRAHQTNPLSRTDLTFLQLSLDFAGRPGEAQAVFEQTRTLFPQGFLEEEALFRLWSRKDASPAAIRRQFRQMLISNDTPAASIDSILDKYDHADTARADIRRRYDESVRQNAPLPYDTARYADHFGDKDLALTALRRGLIDLGSLTLHEPWQPFETDLRTDKRFKDLLRDLGLVDYFRATGNWGDFCKPIGKDDFECH